MRLIIIIATIVLVAQYSNIPGFFKLTGADVVMTCDDTNGEEEKKTEKEDTKKFKSEKFNWLFDHTALLTFFNQQKRDARHSGACLKGHCAGIEQPPEA